MSFFDDASLVMIPSGYKTSKVYSVKPTDGTGDLAFTRSNDTATRVGPDGLIEKVRTNVLTYSQTFSDASWQVGLATKTLGQTDPNGGNTAALISNTLEANGSIIKAVTLTANVPNTISIYIKAASSGSVSLRIDDLTTGPEFLVNYNTNWQRFSVTKTVNQASCNFIIGGYLSFTAGESIQIAFAQAETGDVATGYIPTTTAAVSVGPVANVPRLDYLDSSCPKLLLEPQRSSLVTFSEQLDNAAWTKNAATITANASVSPDGYTNADTLTESTFTSDSAFIYETVVVTPSTAYTTSVFVKQGAGRYVYLRNYYAAGNAYYTVVVDTQTGTITQASVGSSITNASSSIEAYGNGWYRVRATQTSAIEVAFLTVIGLSDIATPTVGTFGQITIASNAGRSASFWGYQLEAGAYATSYIPTLGAAVTRGVDAASKTSASALIGQTQGTIFWEFEFTTSVAAGSDSIINIDNGSFGNTIYLNKNATGNIVSEIYVGGAVQATFTTAPQVAGTYKVAIGYANNNAAFFVNGVQVGTTDTSCSVPAMSRIQLGNGHFGASTDKTAQLLLFPTRLSNADLAALTA